VTIAVPSFGTRPLLELCLASIRALTDLDPARIEVIVVDTGSTDGSRELVARVPFARLETLDGLVPGAAAHGAALDRALALARGSWLATLDADAYPRRPGWLESLLAAARLPGGPAAAVGAEKDVSGHSWLRRLGARLRGALARAPRATGLGYIRPNRALYRTEVLRRHALDFAPRPRAVGEGLARRLEAIGEPIVRLAPADLDALVGHVRHASLALNPKLFPDMRPRVARAVRRRIDELLSSPEAVERIEQLRAGLG